MSTFEGHIEFLCTKQRAAVHTDAFRVGIEHLQLRGRRLDLVFFLLVEVLKFAKVEPRCSERPRHALDDTEKKCRSLQRMTF
jgi:hypothetical protein